MTNTFGHVLDFIKIKRSKQILIQKLIHSLVRPDSWQGLHTFQFFFLSTGKEEKLTEKMWALLGHTLCGLGLNTE